VNFDRAELDRLVTLIFSTTISGGRWAKISISFRTTPGYILQTDHHNVIHVSFRDSVDVDEWVRQMEDRRFPLPDDVPDSTFKKPAWMRNG